jgi:integrase
VSADWIRDIVRAGVASIGLDPDQYAGHSLRAGMITEMDSQGVSLAAIMQRSGHRSYQVAARYVRHADPYAHDPLAKRA